MLLNKKVKGNNSIRIILFPGWCRYGLLFLVFFFAFSPFSLNAATALKKARLVTLWKPQAQFAGYYVALDKGIYVKHGIDLSIISGGAGKSSEEILRKGEADFAVLWLATAIQERSSGTRILNLSQIVQGSSMMLVTRRSSGIRRLEDLNMRKVGLWSGTLSLLPHFLFKKYGIKVNEVRQSYTMNLFLRGGVDAASAMWYNEYHMLIESGIDADELNVFFLNDYGVKFPEDGLYALEKTVTRDPGLARAFIEASLEGWRYAFEHPDESVGIVLRQMQQAHMPANRSHQKWTLERLRDLALPLGGNMFTGTLKTEDYEELAHKMLDAGLIRYYPPYSEFIWRPAL
jgi:NitT/TauT family transport system substrate-binding protein